MDKVSLKEKLHRPLYLSVLYHYLSLLQQNKFFHKTELSTGPKRISFHKLHIKLLRIKRGAYGAFKRV